MLILLIAWLPVVISLVFVKTVLLMEAFRKDDGELKMFYNLLYISLGFAGFLMTVVILQNQIAFTRSEYAVSVAVELILLFSPMAIVVREVMAPNLDRDRESPIEDESYKINLGG